MKKSTRIVSLLLVLLMLVGMMPLALFATGTDAGSGATDGLEYGKPSKLPTAEEIAAIGATQKVLADLEDGVFTQNNADPKTLNLEATAEGTGVPIYTASDGKQHSYYASSNLHLVNSGEVSSWYYMLEENGNKSIKVHAPVTKDEDGNEVKNTTGEHYLQSYARTTGEDIVFGFDLKLEADKKAQSGTLVQFCTSFDKNEYNHKSRGTQGINLLGLDGDGKIYLSANTSVTLGYLNADTYTTVAVRVDITANRFYVYINGVCTEKAGYEFLTETTRDLYSVILSSAKDTSKIATTNPNAKLTDKTVTFTDADGASKTVPLYEYSLLDYYLMGVRSFQVNFKNVKDKYDMPIYIDNAFLYTKATNAAEKLVYIGEDKTEYPNGFVEANGKVYYYVNNSRIATPTYNVNGVDYYFNKNGEALAADRISLIDVKAYLNGTTNEKDVYEETNGLYAIKSRGEYITTFTNGTATLADFLESTCVEWNVYTEGIQHNTMLPLYFTFDDTYTLIWNESKQKYENKPLTTANEINFDDKNITTYTNVETTKAGYRTYGNPKAVDGWTTLTFNSTESAFDSTRITRTLEVLAEKNKTPADVKLLNAEFKQWSTWGITSGGNYKNTVYAADKTTKILNQDYAIYFTSLNLVKYIRPATSIADLGSTGWITAANGDKYYFPHWDHKLVKGATVEIDGIGYVFDDDGKLVGKANGVHEIQFKDTRYYVDGVMQVGDAYGKYVAGDKVYAINATGDYLGDYAEYTFAKAYADIDRKYDRENYLVKVDFNNISLGKKENQGTHGDFAEAAITDAGLVATRRGTYTEIVEDASGDHALKWNGYSTSLHSYFEIPGSKFNNATNVAISFDIKLGENWAASATLVQMLVREEKDADGKYHDKNLLAVNEQGYVWNNSNKGIVKLSSAEYTNITLVLRTPGQDPETSKYVAYVDIYVNGVKLVDNECYYNDTLKYTYVQTARCFQMTKIAQPSSMYLDDIYVYALEDGETPDNIVDMSTVALKNGFVTEGSALRYYENGIFAFNETFEVADQSGKNVKYTADNCGVVTKFTNVYNMSFVGNKQPNSSTYMKYEDEHAAVAMYTTKLINVDFKIPAEMQAIGKFTEYDKLLIDVYLPEYTGKYASGNTPVPSEIIFTAGETERFYELSYDEETKTYTPIKEIAKPSGVSFPYDSKTNANITYDDGITRGTRIGKDSNGNLFVTENGTYYGRTQDYAQTKVRLDEKSVGWNTITININKNFNLEILSMKVSGWDMNEDRDWNPSKNGDKSFTDLVGEEYHIGYANLRLVNESADVAESVVPGWNKDKTSYVSLDTLSPLTGIQRVDGLYYDFADGTSATLLNGIYTYDIYKTRNGGWYYSEATPCEYVDGKPMFASVSGNTLSMEGKIEVNYYLNLSVKPKSDTYVEFTVNGQVQTFALKNATYVEKQGYKTTVAIPAAEMADTIKAVVKYADGTVLATFADYSAVEYAYDILSSEKEEYVRAHDAVKAMLNYAAASQVYFGHNTDNLANSELSPEDKALIEDTSVITGAYSQSPSAGFSGATYVSSTLGLEGTTTLYHFFTLGEGASIDDYDVTVSGGLEVEKTLVGGRMRVAVSGIIAANLNEEYTVTLTKGEETLSVTYSAMKYAELVVTRYADNAEYASLVNVMKALYEYWDAAYDYANPTDVSLYDASYTLLY